MFVIEQLEPGPLKDNKETLSTCKQIQNTYSTNMPQCPFASSKKYRERSLKLDKGYNRLSINSEIKIWIVVVGWLLTIPAICYCISGVVCSDDCMYCQSETEAADQTLYLTQSQYTDTGPTSPCNARRLPG